MHGNKVGLSVLTSGNDRMFFQGIKELGIFGFGSFPLPILSREICLFCPSSKISPNLRIEKKDSF